MGTAIVVTSGKGGVGKTTCVANIGMALAKFGKKVALIDADIGLRNLDLVLGLENRIVYDIVDVVEGRASIKKALVRDKRYPDRLYLLPAAQTRDKTAVSPEQMKELVSEMKKDFEFVVVDSPAGIEQGFRNAISGADWALVVTTPELSAVRDADRVIGLLENAGFETIHLVINRVNPKMLKRGDMLTVEDVKEILAVDIIGIVPEDEQVTISTNRGEPLTLDERTPAGYAFANIARRIMGQNVPFDELDRRRGLFGIIGRFFRKG